jgi:hypothetical protein
MAATRKLTVEVLGDAKSVLRAFGNIGEEAGNIGGKLVDFGKKAAVAFAGLAAGGVVIGKQLVDAASDLNEVTSKTEVIFGDAADAVFKFAENAGSAFGQSERAALDAASNFGTFGKSAGLTGDALSAFSTDLVGLSSDLASFANTSPEEAAQALGAALRGESEPLRRYGVLLDAATLQQKALEMGIYDGSGALDAQQKILAANAVIFEQTTDAQGDFARTSEGVANQQRILAAQFENVKARLGQALLPAFASFLGFITDKVIPGVERFVNIFQEEGIGGIVKRIGQSLPAIQEKLSQYGQALVDWIGPRIGPALEKLGEFAGRVGNWLIDTGLPLLWEKLQELGSALVEWIGPRIGPAVEQIGRWIAALAQWLIDDGLPLMVDKLIQLGNALVDWIKPRIVPALLALGELLAAILNWIVTEAIPKIAAEALKLAGALLSWLVELVPQAIAGLAGFVLKLVGELPGIFLDLVKAMFDKGLELGSNILDGIVQFVADMPELIWNAFGVVFDKFVEIGKEIINKIIEGVKASPGAIGRAISDNVGEIVLNPTRGTLGSILGIRIPFMADGGIVTAPTLAVIGEAGPEAVVPLDRAGGMAGGNIVVNVAGSVTSERDLVESIRRGLVNSQRNGSPLIYSNI